MPRASVRAVRSIPDRVPADSRTLGWSALEWTAEYLLQPDGPNAGEPWQYTDEQVRIILRWYGIDDRGRFVYRRGVLRRMKGWGKDPFCASLAAIELCGPCRFDGFDAKRMPVAIPHPAPWVQIAAVSKDQTRNTMTLFPGMLSKAAIDDYQIDPGKEIIYARGSGRIEAVTSSPRALEGGRPTLVVKNESQHWLPNNDGIAMSESIDRNLGKSRDGAARSIEITNAHLPGEGSAAELTHDAWKSTGGNVPGLMYDSVEAPPVASLEDLAAVKRGLIAARGDSEWLNVDRLVEEIADPATPEWLGRRFYLNQVVAVDAERWLPAGAWDATVSNREIADGARVVLGFDGSYNGDATVLVVATVEDVPHIDAVGWWEKDPADRAWRVPRQDVVETIRQACRRWKVVEIAVDPALWQTDLEDLLEDGFPVVEFQQRGQRMIDSTQRFYEAVTRGQITHSADSRLARHIGNAMVKVDARGPRLTKEHRSPSAPHIDGAVAAVMALQRAGEVGPPAPRVRFIPLV